MTLKGADISRYNGNCDLAKAKAGGLDFIILKVGSIASDKDAQFESNYQKAKSAGLPVGGYWYLYAKSISDAIAEANQCLSYLQDKQFEYPIWLDLEDPSQAGMSNALRTDIAIAFMQVLEKAGYYTGIYSMRSWFDSKFDMTRLKNYDLWVASWNAQHGYRGVGTIGMWQYTNRDNCQGINNTGEGGIDMNYSYIDYPSVIKRAGLNGFKKADISARVESKSEAQKMIDKMTAWLGKSEANGQHKDIINIYNNHKPLPQGYTVKYRDEWCATTISAAAIQCGLVDKVGKECSVQRFIDIFKQKGIWIEDGTIIPQRGDIICYAWSKSVQPNDNWANHIGLVERVDGATITVLEGNNDEAVKRRTIQVGNGYIRGYARPKYSTQEKKHTEPIEKPRRIDYDLVTYANEVDKVGADMITQNLHIPAMSISNYEKNKDKYHNVIHVGGSGSPRGAKVLAGANRYDTYDIVEEFIKMNK